MTLWALGGLINGITSTILGGIVYAKNRKKPANVLYGLFALSISVWSYSYFFWQISTDEASALFWCHFLMAGAIFIPIVYLHHIFVLLDPAFQKSSQRKIIVFGYIFCLISLFLNFTPLFVKGVSPKLWFKYWPDAGIAFPYFLFIWLWFVVYGAFIIIKSLSTAVGVRKHQLRYILIATVVGWIGGATNYPLWFNINIPPIGNILASFYVAIVAYAIVKYRFMDIQLIATRAGIFVTVYAFILGIPFWIGLKVLGKGPWLLPVALMAVCATVVPFIYLYLQKRAEDRLLKEQRAYQATLQRASAGMGRVKDLKRLLDLIVHIVVRAVKLEHGEVFLWHEQSNQFVLKALKGRRFADLKNTTLSLNSPLILHFQKNKEALVYEEIKQRSSDYADKELQDIEAILNELEAALAVPSFIEDRLIAIIILGKKTSGKLYSEDDLTVFSILANQSALAIENAQFYEDMKNTQEQLFRAEKMATIGTMADGLSHQINNRLHAMGFIAGDALDSIALKKKEPIPEVMQGLINDLNYALTRIQDNVKQGGEIVQGLLKYTRKGEEGFSPIDLNKLLDSTVEMLQFKIKLNEMELQRKLQSSTPPVKGNFTQLQEVFFNIIDNSYDAIIQRKNELKEQGYKGCVAITAERLDGQLEITIIDNGMGVKGEDFKKLFTPFFTTKLSSRKGTGLGLYVIRQIIEENHKGKVDFSSTYQQGSQTKIYLPVAVV